MTTTTARSTAGPSTAHATARRTNGNHPAGSIFEPLRIAPDRGHGVFFGAPRVLVVAFDLARRVGDRVSISGPGFEQIEAVLNDETGEQVHHDQTAEPLCHDEVTGL